MGEGEKGDRTPRLFTAVDGSPVLAFAGLWDHWRNPASGGDVLSATIIVSGASRGHNVRREEVAVGGPFYVRARRKGY